MQPLIPYFDPPKLTLTGDIAIHAFGVLVAVGFVVGQRVSETKAGRYGGDPALVNRLVTWLVLGTFLGGHWGHLLFYDPQSVVEDPMVIFRFWQGLSSYGGFLACVPITIWFFHRARTSYWPYADALAHGMGIGWFFGRLGCFSAHDHPGGPTNFWLGVPGMCRDAPGDASVACHDLGLYESIWSLTVFLLFMALDTKPRFPGFYVGMLAFLYGPFRFVLDFFRVTDVDVRYVGLTPAQYFSILVSGLGIWILQRQRALPPSWRGESAQAGAVA